MQISPDTVAAKAASAAQWGGSGIAAVSGSARIFGLTTDQWSVLGAMVGIAVAVLGLLANLWFKWQHLQIAKAKAQADPDE